MLYRLVHDPAYGPGGNEDLVQLWIGPQRDRRAPLIEVLGRTEEPRDLVAFHSMRLTEQNRRDYDVDRLVTERKTKS
ncbi:MAG: hypothetical protein LBT54_02670 [Bifidobacteriaceae bacterium]|jgi:hypothetical protein|nr:hypothetical protein [Bifidobacteriaceae bacterium]